MEHIFKQKFLTELKELKENNSRRVTSGSIKDLQEYGRCVGIHYAYTEVEHFFEELWKKHNNDTDGFGDLADKPWN